MRSMDVMDGAWIATTSMPPAMPRMRKAATVMPMYCKVTLRTLDWLADHIPPIRVMPIKTTALVSIPVTGVKIFGIKAARIAPPATYCKLMMTSCTRT